MMPERAFNRGFLAGVLLMIGGQAVHWFITPASHPDPGVARVVAVAAQAAVGFGGALWLVIRQRSRAKAV